MSPRNQDSDPALTGGADDAVEEARNIQEMDEAQEPADEGVGAMTDDQDRDPEAEDLQAIPPGFN